MSLGTDYEGVKLAGPFQGWLPKLLSCKFLVGGVVAGNVGRPLCAAANMWDPRFAFCIHSCDLDAHLIKRSLLRHAFRPRSHPGAPSWNVMSPWGGGTLFV